MLRAKDIETLKELLRMYKRNPVKLTADYPTEKMETVQKRSLCLISQPRIV